MVSLFQAPRWIYRAWRFRVKLDPLEVRFLLEHLCPGEVALDIGAHKGAYTYWMRRAVGASGKVFAFEPQPSLAGRLRENIARLHFDNVEVVNGALSSSPGRVELSVPSGGDSPGATLEGGLYPEASQRYAVDVMVLDEFLRRETSGPVRFIKCDVEGHEFEVFQGASQTLQNDRPFLLFECEQRFHPDCDIREKFTFLSGFGYEGFFLSENGLEPLERFDPDLHQNRDRHPYCNNFAFLPLHV